MKKNIVTSVFATLMLLFASCNGNAQAKKTTTVQVIPFHSEHLATNHTNCHNFNNFKIEVHNSICDSNLWN